MRDEHMPGPGQPRTGGILTGLTRAADAVLLVIMVVMGLVLAANIVLRYWFGKPIFWSNVVSRYAYIYIVFLGTAVSYIEGSHAQIDFVYKAAPGWLRGVYDLLHCLIMMFLGGILIVYGMQHVLTMWPVHSPVLPSLSIGVVYLSVPLSFAVIMVFLAQWLTRIRFR